MAFFIGVDAVAAYVVEIVRPQKKGCSDVHDRDVHLPPQREYGQVVPLVPVTDEIRPSAHPLENVLLARRIQLPRYVAVKLVRNQRGKGHHHRVGASFAAEADHFGISGKKSVRGATILMVAPTFFGFGMAMNHLCLYLGVNTILWIDLDQDAIGRAFQKEKPNYFVGGPAFVDGFFRHVHGDLSYLEDYTGGGEAMPTEKEEELNRFLADHGCKIKYTTGFGMTELSSVVSMQVFSRLRKGSVGLPLVHCNVKVLDPETKEELSYNEIGELYFSSPALMYGYYNDEASTNDIISTDQNGERWIQTGDLGRVDEDGFIYFEGRLKRIFVALGDGGATVNKLFPQRLEEFIAAHPLVKKCAVDVVPDALRMNVPVAYIVLQDDVDETIDPKGVIDELTEKIHHELADYLHPTNIFIIEHMPMTMSGKVDYKALKSIP